MNRFTLFGTPRHSTCLAGLLFFAALFPAGARKPDQRLWRFQECFLELPVKSHPSSATLWVPIDGIFYACRLERRSLRAACFELIADEGSRKMSVQPPPVATYRGRIPEIPDSTVVLTLRENGWEGRLQIGRRVYCVEPAESPRSRKKGVPPFDTPGAPSSRLHRIYSAEDVVPRPCLCGFSRLEGLPVRLKNPAWDDKGSVGFYKVTEIAVDADYEFFSANGSSVEATLTDIESVMNAVGEIYERELEIRYTITRIVVRTSAADPYDSNDPEIILEEELRPEWLRNQGSVPRDVVHLFTGKDLVGDIVGVAYPGTVCDPLWGFGLSASRFSQVFLQRVVLTAHELGHNWNAGHCDDPGQNVYWATCCDTPAYNMCSVLGRELRGTFCPPAKAAILAFRNRLSCLEDGPPVAVETSTPTSTQTGKLPTVTPTPFRFFSPTSSWTPTPTITPRLSPKPTFTFTPGPPAGTPPATPTLTSTPGPMDRFDFTGDDAVDARDLMVFLRDSSQPPEEVLDFARAWHLSRGR